MKMGISLFALILVSVAAVHAEIQPAGVFGDNMVLQAGKKTVVFGTASPGEEVSVSVCGRTGTSKADTDGNWRVPFEPFDAGGPYELIISGENRIVLNNVLIGEVWLCSGQSNMASSLKKTEDADAEIRSADYPEIRFFWPVRGPAASPRTQIKGVWAVCSPKTADRAFAVAYYFGRDIHKSLDVPVGLIMASTGASCIENWTSIEALRSDADIEKNVTEVLKKSSGFSDWKEAQEAYMGWLSAKGPDKPERPPVAPRFVPSIYYNSVIAPLTYYAIRGVIWYQGEGNTPHAGIYEKEFPVMIRSWREAWGNDPFPFLFVQLARIGKKEEGVRQSSDWASLREAQRKTLSVPNTAMAVSFDVTDGNLHPKRKRPIGARLALAARAVAYGEDIIYSGPIIKDARLEGDQVRCTFDYVGGGLTIRDGDDLRGFTLCAEDGLFRKAHAKIQGDAVMVWSDSVKTPTVVRYGWAQWPDGNLYNKADLPASPFRVAVQR